MTKSNELGVFKLPLWKRIFDIVFASCALIALSPFLLVIIIAIRFESKGPIIYKAKRVGSNYKIFDFLKFRSMYVGADKHLKKFNELNQYAATQQETLETILFDDDTPPEDIVLSDNDVILVSDDCTIVEQSYLDKRESEQKNAFVKIENDPRITKLGRFMRKYSVDELPQLINILKGDMSVVGNRPLPLYEAEMLTQDDDIDRFMGPAGLTGLWQVEKRGDAGKLSAEERKKLDIRYVHEFSLALDIKIILKTFTSFIQKENV